MPCVVDRTVTVNALVSLFVVSDRTATKIRESILYFCCCTVVDKGIEIGLGIGSLETRFTAWIFHNGRNTRMV